MILTHGANSLSRGSGGNFVNIGGRDYRYVQIGNQLWMAENLDYAFDGLIVDPDTFNWRNPLAFHLDRDEATYGYNGLKLGLYYNYFAQTALISALSALNLGGWKIPSRSDFDTLFANAGANNAERELNLNAEYPNPKNLSEKRGTDIFGFHSMFTGYININQSDGTVSWVNEAYNACYNADAPEWNGYWIGQNSIQWYNPCNVIRLVKNL